MTGGTPDDLETFRSQHGWSRKHAMGDSGKGLQSLQQNQQSHFAKSQLKSRWFLWTWLTLVDNLHPWFRAQQTSKNISESQTNSQVPARNDCDQPVLWSSPVIEPVASHASHAAHATDLFRSETVPVTFAPRCSAAEPHRVAQSSAANWTSSSCSPGRWTLVDFATQKVTCRR